MINETKPSTNNKYMTDAINANNHKEQIEAINHDS